MKNNVKRNTLICMRVGYYDGNGNYNEATCNSIRLKDIHKSIRRGIYLDHDITFHVVPGVEARMFAKRITDIEAFLEINDNSDFIKSMLDAWSQYNQSQNGEYIYMLFICVKHSIMM